MIAKKIEKARNRIEKIKQRLLKLGDMRPGTLSKQYNVCNKHNCKCKDKNNPKRHGPYYQLSYTRKGKSKTEFVKEVFLADVKMQVKNYELFKKLVDEMIEASIEVAQLLKLQSKKK